MAYIPDQQPNTGLFVETTAVWDASLLSDIDVNSEQFKLLLIRLYQNVNNIVIALNNKDTGFYIQEEFVTGQLYFATTNNQLDLRPVFRKTIDFGALPNTGVKTVPHGLVVTDTWKWVNIYGAATNPVTLIGIPIPQVDSVIGNVEIEVGATDITITTLGDYSGYVTCYIVLEFLKI